MSESIPLSDDGLTILLFHGVIEAQTNPVRNYLGKHLEQCHFVAMLERLLENGTAISMDQIVAFRERGEPFPPRSFAVTFDDGFENNHRIAAPILKRFGVPATFYITTGFVDGNRMSWIDRIEHAIENAKRQNLKLSWLKAPVRIVTTVEKIAALETIRAKVKRDPKVDVDALIASVFEQTDVETCEHGDGPLDLKMSWTQVSDLAAEPLFTIGGHGHRHAILSFLSDDQLREELDRSLEMLKVHGIVPTHYAYPEGQIHCYSQSVIDALKARGIKCAPTAMPGVNTTDTDLFELYRLMPTSHSLSWLGERASSCAE